MAGGIRVGIVPTGLICIIDVLSIVGCKLFLTVIVRGAIVIAICCFSVSYLGMP